MNHDSMMLFLYGVAFAMGIVLGLRDPIFFIQSGLCVVLFVLRVKRLKGRA
jgi:hypothetical protein